MPKSSHHIALSRQWEMLKRIPSRPPGITSAELSDHLRSEGYEVSKRTVERDLNELSYLFGLACNDASIPYGWHWLPGKHLALGNLDINEAISLNLAELLINQMLPASLSASLAPTFDQARQKLALLEKNTRVRIRDKIRFIPTSLNATPPTIHPETLASVQHALLNENQLLITYFSLHRNETSDLLLSPYALIQRGNTPYLIANDPANPATPRLYAIHRILSAESTEQKATIPKSFSIDSFIASGGMDFGPRTLITLKATLSPTLADLLAETPICPNQKILRRANSAHLTAKVHDTWQLHFWLRSQGEALTVTAPKYLKESMIATLRSTLDNYARPE